MLRILKRGIRRGRESDKKNYEAKSSGKTISKKNQGVKRRGERKRQKLSGVQRNKLGIKKELGEAQKGHEKCKKDEDVQKQLVSILDKKNVCVKEMEGEDKEKGGRR